MRIQNAFSGRPQFYDRNPIAVGFNTAQTGLAPAGFTVQILYTVPSGKKAMVTGGFMRWRRVTVAAPVGVVQDRLVTTGTMFGTIRTTVNTVDAVEHRDVTTNSVFPAGTAIQYDTSDASTGGTCDHQQGLQITEFDA